VAVSRGSVVHNIDTAQQFLLSTIGNHQRLKNALAFQVSIFFAGIKNAK